jgi:cytoskeleton protein RodZ
MSDTSDDAPATELSQAPATAGGLLRQARVAKGLHVAALATSIKVAPRKLELLEADRYDELPGATFTRALAQTVCRTLKIDSAPVLALLPQPADLGLSQLSRGLNEPFRDKPGRRVPSDLSFLKSPIVLAAGVLVLASAAMYLLPAGWIAQITQVGGGSVREADTAAEPATSASAVMTLPPPTVVMAASDVLPAAEPVASGPALASAPVVPAVPAAASTPAAAATLSSASAAVAGPSGALLLRAQAESWIEVVDGRGNPLMSRLLQAGETVGLDGPTPLRVRIGNASATQVSFRGRPVELVPSRDNVAKLELR